VSRTVTLIRHAETEANASLRWQGSIDAPFTSRGRDQVARLGKRFADRTPPVLIASDLDRAMATASALGEPVADPTWREFHVGRWEGLTTAEIRDRFPGQLEALFAGEDVELGGGERMSSFRERVVAGFDELVDRLDDGEEAVVVTHGGVVWTIARHVLGLEGGAHGVVLPHNTSVTRVRVDDDGRRQLSVYNDTAHLVEVPVGYGPAGTIVSLFRHGETEGNVAGRWQGRSDSPLTEFGRWQIEAATAHVPPLDSLYTSPLGRTVDTATVLGSHFRIDALHHEDLVEMSFGSWEDLTSAEAAAADPELFDAIYVRGDDRPRGGDGESFTEAGRRLEATIAAIADDGGGGSIGVVSHGAVIRAYVAAITGLEFSDRHRIPVPRNASMSRVVYGDGGASLLAYNVAPHLD
jgi:glucosyl-3-phosphoglycerate phosphatase